jgi:hypothetical protein
MSHVANGKKGGRARALSLSPRRRRAIAQQAAATRWSPVGQVVGGMVGAMRCTESSRLSCGHNGCTRLATEVEAFRLRTAPGSRYQTKLTWFARCEKHEHSHWKQIGFAQ